MNWQKLQNLKGYGDVKQYITTLENDAEDVAKKYPKELFLDDYWLGFCWDFVLWIVPENKNVL